MNTTLHPIVRSILLLSAFILGASGARAQYNYGLNYQTNTINVVSNWVGNGTYVVGSNTFLNALIINSGGVLSNGTGSIGVLTSGSNNAVVVNAGIWSNAFDLYVGYSGKGSTLTISNGGAVYNDFVFMGYNSSSSNNVVTVNGTGSVWSNNYLNIGESGSGNLLVVTNGGKVVSSNSYMGDGFAGSSSNNVVTVTGTGSVWRSQSTLIVGEYGSGNQLIVANGGAVFSGASQLGNDTASSGNKVTVTGSGSVWTNTGASLYVGASGSGNQLVVTNGGQVVSNGGRIGDSGSSNNVVTVGGNGATWQIARLLYVGGSGGTNTLNIGTGGSVIASNVFVGFVGSSLGADGNRLNVTGGSLFVTNAPGNATLEVGRGTVACNGGNITVDRLLLTNGASSVMVFNSGTLSSRGSFVTNNSWFTIGDGSGATATYQLLGGTHSFANGVTNNSDGVIFGNGTITGAGVVNAAGGMILASNGVLRLGLIGDSNAGTISTVGAGSTVVLTNKYLTSTGYIALKGFGLAQAGGVVTNQSTITGPGDLGSSLYNDTTGFVLATNGILNIATNANAGVYNRGTFSVVTGGILDIRSTTGLTNDGSIWITGGSLYDTNVVDGFGTPVTTIFGKASAGRMTISNGLAQTGSSFLGYNVAGSNSAVTVTGTGSVWSTRSDFYAGGGAGLYVGYQGAGNTLTITNSGKVFSDGGLVGNTSSSSNNSVLVTGVGSVWSNSSLIDIGTDGASNTLTIANGGKVYSAGGLVGRGISNASSNNVVTVTGAGSVWSNSGVLYVGQFGVGNTVTITNGGKIFSGSELSGTHAYIGYSPGSSISNAVTVAGNGATWLNQRDLYVGFLGATNTLNIDTGGSVIVSNAYVGFLAGADGSKINVTGGSLYATNAPGTGTLDIRRGTLTFNGGNITVDRLALTNGTSSVITFSGGMLNSGGAVVTNNQTFTVGDGVSVAQYHLLGGTHSFASGMRIRSNGTLSGCGTVTGNLTIDSGGLVLGDCGGTLTFTGILTNNGTLRVINGGVLEGYGTMVNNGTIDAINGTTNFHGAFINNGTVLNATSPGISQATKSGQDFVVQIPSVIGHTYQLQNTVSLTPTNWISTGSSQAGTGGVLTFTDPGATTNAPAGYYHIQVTAP